MGNLSKEKLHEYNEVPIFYCKHCLSLKVRYVSSIEDSEFCDECGSTDIAQENVREWEKMYEEKYGHKLLEEY